MSLLDMAFKKKAAEEEALLQQERMGLLKKAYGSAPSDVTGTMTSNEFDAQGNPINVRNTVQEPRVSPGTGLLGDPSNRTNVANFRMAGMQAGIKNEALNSMIQDAKTVGDFKSRPEQLKTLEQMRKTHEQLVAKPKAALNTFKMTTNLLKDRGGFNKMTAQDDLAMISNFAQMQRPGEAMNEGDVTNILRTSGFGDILEAFIKAKGGNALGADVRKKIYNTMKSMNSTVFDQYKAIRDQTKQMFDQGGFSPDVQGIMQPEINVDPYAKYEMINGVPTRVE